MIISPLEQFDVIVFPVVLTNLAIQLIIILLFLFAIQSMFLSGSNIVFSSKLNLIQVKIFDFVKEIYVQNVRYSLTQYYIYFFSMFMFVFVLNLVGMVPYSFTVTSHLSITLALAFISFVGSNILGVYKNGFNSLNLFLPSGVPVFMAPFLVMIEFISYISRVVSLSVRLFANMMAGHTLLKILAGFSFSLLVSSGLLTFLGVLTFLVILIIIGLEVMISFLQAYVFTTLSIIYLNDAINVGH